MQGRVPRSIPSKETATVSSQASISLPPPPGFIRREWLGDLLLGGPPPLPPLFPFPTPLPRRMANVVPGLRAHCAAGDAASWILHVRPLVIASSASNAVTTGVWLALAFREQQDSCPHLRPRAQRRAARVVNMAACWVAACCAGIVPAGALLGKQARRIGALRAVAELVMRRRRRRRKEHTTVHGMPAAEQADDALLGAIAIAAAGATAQAAAPRVFATAERTLATLPVAARYQSARHATARLDSRDAEATWRRCHRDAAQRLGKLMTDIPANSDDAPFARVLRWARRVNVHTHDRAHGNVSFVFLLSDYHDGEDCTDDAASQLRNGDETLALSQRSILPSPTVALTRALAPAPYLSDSSEDTPSPIKEDMCSPPTAQQYQLPPPSPSPLPPPPLAIDQPQLPKVAFEMPPSDDNHRELNQHDEKPNPPSTIALCMRAMELALIFAPLVLAVLPTAAVMLRMIRAYETCGGAHKAAAAAYRARVRAVLWSFVAASCASCGAALIKMCQWMSARKDVLPEDANAAFAKLQDDAPVHSVLHTRRCLEHLVDTLPWPVRASAAADAGVDMSDRDGILRHIFPHIDYTPLASGSVAQVHRAQMRAMFYHPMGGYASRSTTTPTVPVVLKVRHPRVRERIEGDFALLIQIVSLFVYAFPASTFFRSLEQALAQFAERLSLQADLRQEAQNLLRFHRHFREWRGTVTAPQPLLGFERCDDVLVETYERGESVGKWIAEMKSSSVNASTEEGESLEPCHPLGPSVVGRGADTYLKMLLSDRFVHGDLHPGNILCRTHGSADTVEIVLLDFGLCEELEGDTRHHFLSFLSHMASGSGSKAAHHLLAMSNKSCDVSNDSDALAFSSGIEELFSEHCGTSRGAVDVDIVLRQVLWLCREHGVSVNAQCASLVVCTSVLVGMAKMLDPRVNLLDAVTPSLMALSLTGESLGRLYGGM